MNKECPDVLRCLPKRIVNASSITSLLIVLLIFAIQVKAGPPEYMELKLKVGQALEIEGEWNAAEGIFVATDIESLPKPRRLKLRGKIDKVDAKSQTVSLYGLSIEVNDKTEFIESGRNFSFDSLSAGMRVEISCKITSDGTWAASKIKARDVKESNKIKGTVSRVAVDGKPPDTIEISSKNTLEKIHDSIVVSGIRILLLKKTDVEDAMLFDNWIGDRLFGDLNKQSTLGMTKGYALNEKIFVSGEYRNNLRNRREFDLTSKLATDSDESEQDIRLEAMGFLSQGIRSYGEFRVRKRYLIAADDGVPSTPYEVDLIQIYLLAPNIGNKGIALQVGRQDFDEPREWLFDDYLDAVKLYYYGVNNLLVEAAFIYGGESYKEKIRTWKDLFGQLQWYFDRDNSVSGYYMSRTDTDEIRNREPIWWGIRYYGNIRDVLRPWADFAIIRGTDKHRDLQGWAMDIGATVKSEHSVLRPSITVGYAQGSGDSTNSDQTDYRFRQTGYDDNVDRFGGTRSVSYYGSVVDPELSNLKIFTLGAGVQPTEKSSIEVIYHTYKQEYPDNDVKGSNLIPLPFGVSTDVGWALDVVIGIPKLWDHVRTRWVLGWFNPGEAFEPLYTEVAFLSKIDIKVGF